MKAVMYISKASRQGTAPWMPHDYVSLLNVSRINNTENGLTGFLTYQKGYFFQYLEGPNDKLVSLMANIVKDPRHTDVHLIMNREITARSFVNWSIPLGNKLMNDVGFSKFAEKYYADFAVQTKEHKKTLSRFHVFKFLEKRSRLNTALESAQQALAANSALEMDIAV